MLEGVTVARINEGPWQLAVPKSQRMYPDRLLHLAGCDLSVYAAPRAPLFTCERWAKETKIVMLTDAVTPGAWEAGTAGANYTGGPLDYFPPVNAIGSPAAMETTPSPTKTPRCCVTDHEPLHIT